DDDKIESLKVKHMGQLLFETFALEGVDTANLLDELCVSVHMKCSQLPYQTSQNENFEKTDVIDVLINSDNVQEILSK
ncbi:unnamed protein product, partial [Didymodactylos carnosus]